MSPHAEVTGDLQEMRARNEVHRAQREHLRDMDLDDQDVSVLRAYSFFLLHHDAFDEALDVHRRTLELDPASPLSTKITAEMFYVARRYDECIAECRKAFTLEPNDSNLMLSLWLGRCWNIKGGSEKPLTPTSMAGSRAGTSRSPGN